MQAASKKPGFAWLSCRLEGLAVERVLPSRGSCRREGLAVERVALKESPTRQASERPSLRVQSNKRIGKVQAKKREHEKNRDATPKDEGLGGSKGLYAKQQRHQEGKGPATKRPYFRGLRDPLEGKKAGLSRLGATREGKARKTRVSLGFLAV